MQHSNCRGTIFQAYARDSNYSEDIVEEFYGMIQSKIDALPRNNTYILLRDFNAKVGDQHSAWPEVVGIYGLGEVIDRDSYCNFVQ